MGARSLVRDAVLVGLSIAFGSMFTTAPSHGLFIILAFIAVWAGMTRS